MDISLKVKSLIEYIKTNHKDINICIEGPKYSIYIDNNLNQEYFIVYSNEEYYLFGVDITPPSKLFWKLYNKSKDPKEFNNTLKFDSNEFTLNKFEIFHTSEAYKCTSQSGSGSKKRTKEKINVNNKSKVVYIGPKGGKYVKINGKFRSIKSL